MGRTTPFIGWAMLGVLLAACGSRGAQHAAQADVPWLPLPARHLYVSAPEVTPRPPIPVPPGTPACRAGQLEGASAGEAAATGNVDMPVVLRNKDTSSCYLEGFADVTVIGPASQVLAVAASAANRGTFFADGPVVPIMMEPEHRSCRRPRCTVNRSAAARRS